LDEFDPYDATVRVTDLNASFSQRLVALNLLNKAYHVTKTDTTRILSTLKTQSCQPTHGLTSGMDWACDNTRLSEKDLGSVFKYEEKSTTVVLMLSGEKVGSRNAGCGDPELITSQEPLIWSLNGDHEWEEWLSKVRRKNLHLPCELENR
jgi:hypothetical protein